LVNLVGADGGDCTVYVLTTVWRQRADILVMRWKLKCV